jgi:hypothetical protein
MMASDKGGSSQAEHARRSGQDWQEWTDHQYVEGYFTGGRIPPFYKKERRNGFGYGLLLMGSLMGLGAAAGILSGSVADVSAVFLALLAVLMLVAGVRLLRAA